MPQWTFIAATLSLCDPADTYADTHARKILRMNHWDTDGDIVVEDDGRLHGDVHVFHGFKGTAVDAIAVRLALKLDPYGFRQPSGQRTDDTPLCTLTFDLGPDEYEIVDNIHDDDEPEPDPPVETENGTPLADFLYSDYQLVFTRKINGNTVLFHVTMNEVEDPD